VGVFETDVEVEEAACAGSRFAGVGVVGLVCEDANGGGGNGVIVGEGPDVGQGVGEGGFNEGVFGGGYGLFMAAVACISSMRMGFVSF
jgi:hypothetical protein